MEGWDAPLALFCHLSTLPKAALCLISTPDIKPYILGKISRQNWTKIKKLSKFKGQFYVYSISEVNVFIVEWDYIL